MIFPNIRNKSGGVEWLIDGAVHFVRSRVVVDQKGAFVGIVSGSGFFITSESPFSPASLFAAGEQGVWYDPSDLSTMFQDSAGTVPVTAVEQPVGKILDKSGRGNHASQATATARPVLRARYNLLTYSEDFSNAAWAKAGTTPTGLGNGIWRLTPTATTEVHRIHQSGATIAAAVFTVEAKADGLEWIIVSENSQTGSYVCVNLNTLSVTTGAPNSKIIALEGGWVRISTKVFDSPTHPGSGNWAIYPAPNGAAWLNTSWLGDGVSGILVRKARIERSSLPRATFSASSFVPYAYQRIASATDYDTVGFPLYLETDGVDDGMSTGSIDFTGTDKLSIWAGIRKLTDTAQIVCEFGAVQGNAGSAYLLTGQDNDSLYSSISRGTATLVSTQAGKTQFPFYPAPDSAVVTATHDISGDLSKIRRNGSSANCIDGTGDKGAGNFGNYPLYLFSRGNSSLRWKGHFYGLIIRGAATEDATLIKAEQFLNKKMGGIY